MKRQLGIALLGALLLSVGCNPIKRLSDTEWDHYRALRVYMSEDERNAFLRNKTEEERNEFLQALGVWERFYQYPADVRELILSGDVSRGSTPFCSMTLTKSVCRLCLPQQARIVGVKPSGCGAPCGETPFRIRSVAIIGLPWKPAPCIGV